MNKIISFTVFWIVFLVSLLSSCKGFDPYTSLSELRDSLRTASNDTISFYCIKEKYAVWIHEENEVDDNWGSNSSKTENAFSTTGRSLSLPIIIPTFFIHLLLTIM